VLPSLLRTRWSLGLPSDVTLIVVAGVSAAVLTLVRLAGESYQHPLLVGQRSYTPAVIFHEGEVVAEWRLKPVRLFVVIPGISQLYLPPWLVA
jgi:hypothetical protein